MEAPGEVLEFERFNMLASGGFDLPKRADFILRFSHSAVEVDVAHSELLPSGLVDVRAVPAVQLPFAAPLQLIVEDRRRARRAAGPTFFGGGTGLIGAAEGMAMAAVLGRLSGAFTRNGVVIGAETPDGYLIGEVHGTDVWTVRRWLNARHELTATDDAELEQVASPPKGDWVDHLERLAALRRDGALTADEFAAAKARLLRDVE